MSTDPKKQFNRREFLALSSLAAGSLLIDQTSTALEKNQPFYANTQNELKVIVMGDSLVWGQGLSERDKFAFKAANKIGARIGRRARIIKNVSHSGAAITKDEADRKKFINVYPPWFDSNFEQEGRSEKERAFINGQEDISLSNYYGEVPAPFPTISYQLHNMISQQEASSAELVILDGGANDVDFEDIINPTVHDSDFVTFYMPLLAQNIYGRVKRLLIDARLKFPNAVILYTGYYPAFAPGESHGAIKDLFYFFDNSEGWLKAINRKLELRDIDHYATEAQYRSMWAFSLALYYIRKAITELNFNPSNPEWEGRILFIHPQFANNNTVFAANTFLHRNYRLDSLTDAAKDRRYRAIDRVELLNDLKAVRNVVFHPNQDVFKRRWMDRANNVINKLDGPADLVIAMKECIADFEIPRLGRVNKELDKELKRIVNARRASFLHPNERGAERYSEVCEKRYFYRYYQVSRPMPGDVFINPSAANRRRDILRRYGLENVRFNDMTYLQFFLIDSICLQISVASNSENQITDDVYVDFGNNHRWRLNFPSYTVAGTLSLYRIDQHFKPGRTELFPIDAKGMDLTSISKFVLERKRSNAQARNNDLIISRIVLELNGIKVFESSSNFKLERDVAYRFRYPGRT